MKAYWLLLITLFITYGANWSPYYVQLFSPGQLSVIGNLRNFEEPCIQPNFQASVCRAQYRIPQKFFQDRPQNNVIGIGVVLHATEIICSTTGEAAPILGDKLHPEQTLKGLSTYQVYPISRMRCQGDLLIRAWAPESYWRYGQVDAPAVVGSADSVGSVKTLVEFMRTDLLIVAALLFSALFALGKTLTRIITPPAGLPTPFERYFAAWVLFGFVASGLSETFLPIVSKAYIFVRASSFFSLLAHCAPAVFIAGNSHTTPRKLAQFSRWLCSPLNKNSPIQPLHILFLIFVLNPHSASYFPEVIISFSVLYLYLGISERATLSVCFGIALALDGLKILMFPYLPSSFSTAILVLLIFLDRFWMQISQTFELSSLVDWVHRRASGKSLNQDTPFLLREMGDLFSIQQVTLCIPVQNGAFEILQQKKVEGQWQTVRYINTYASPIFAHVLTTSSPLWHIEEGSILSVNLRKGEPPRETYHSRNFSVLPIIHHSVPVAILGLTNYPETLAQHPFEKLKLETFFNLMLPTLSEAVNSSSLIGDAEWQESCAKLSESIHMMDGNSNFQQVSEKIREQLSFGNFIARLDPGTRRLHVIGSSYESEEAAQLYRDLEFYAVSHNEQGPAPIAVNQKKIVTIANTTWIEEVLHPQSIQTLSKSGTRSCAAVPIFIPGIEHKETDEVWGVLFLESPRAGAFTLRQEKGLTKLANAIQGLLKKMQTQYDSNKAKETLQDLLPPAVYKRIIDSQPIREEEYGLLLMADLRDSTKISRIIGADAWNLWIRDLAKLVAKISQKYDFSLQNVVWDAFYLTRPLGAPGDSDITNAIQMADELNQLFFLEQTRKFAHVLDSTDYVRSRFCLVHGDTTRDMTGILNSQWAIVGTAMASVSKLEQTCKGLRGWFFVGFPNGDILPYGAWQVVDKTVPGTGDKIFRWEQNASRPDVDSSNEEEKLSAA